MDKEKILTPMNHREIDYTAQKLSGCDIPDTFACAEILKWLDETGSSVFDDDLIMDYGTDCLRLYLMFEATPKANDAPFYESWQESALEGIYKFLARSRRLVLTAAYWDEQGGYCGQGGENSAEIQSMRTAIDETRRKIEKYISRGNELPNRHNIVSALMELQKTLQNKLKINEITSSLHKHAVEAAVPHSRETQNTYEVPRAGVNISPNTGNVCNLNISANSDISGICQKYIMMMAQFAPNISKVLWNEIKT